MVLRRGAAARRRRRRLRARTHIRAPPAGLRGGEQQALHDGRRPGKGGIQAPDVRQLVAEGHRPLARRECLERGGGSNTVGRNRPKTCGVVTASDMRTGRRAAKAQPASEPFDFRGDAIGHRVGRRGQTSKGSGREREPEQQRSGDRDPDRHQWRAPVDRRGRDDGGRRRWQRGERSIVDPVRDARGHARREARHDAGVCCRRGGRRFGWSRPRDSVPGGGRRNDSGKVGRAGDLERQGRDRREPEQGGGGDQPPDRAARGRRERRPQAADDPGDGNHQRNGDRRPAEMVHDGDRGSDVRGHDDLRRSSWRRATNSSSSASSASDTWCASAMKVTNGVTEPPSVRSTKAATACCTASPGAVRVE